MKLLFWNINSDGVLVTDQKDVRRRNGQVCVRFGLETVRIQVQRQINHCFLCRHIQEHYEGIANLDFKGMQPKELYFHYFM